MTLSKLSIIQVIALTGGWIIVVVAGAIGRLVGDLPHQPAVHSSTALPGDPTVARALWIHIPEPFMWIVGLLLTVPSAVFLVQWGRARFAERNTRAA